MDDYPFKTILFIFLLIKCSHRREDENILYQSDDLLEYTFELFSK